MKGWRGPERKGGRRGRRISSKEEEEDEEEEEEGLELGRGGYQPLS